MLIPTIETERLAVRAIRDADREPFAAMNSDPEVMRLFPQPLARDESDRFVDKIHERWRSDGFGIWAVERTSDRTFLGFVGLSPPTFEAHFTPCVEVGWRFIRPAWGHGYATEAAQAALRFGFDTAGLAEVVSFTTVSNDRSRRVMERLGMTRDPADDFDHPNRPVGHPIRPHVLYRLSRERWLATHQPT